MYEDSKGTLLHIEDVVKLFDEREAIVMTKEEDGTIWINPINAGEPLQLESKEVTLVFSLFNQLQDLKTDADLLELLSNVEKYASSIVIKKVREKKEKGASKLPDAPREQIEGGF